LPADTREGEVPLIKTEHVGEFAAGGYTLKSAGFLGGMHVLEAGDLSLLGESDELDRDKPLTIIKVVKSRFGHRGRPLYLAIQPGGCALEMTEGTADDVIDIIIQR